MGIEVETGFRNLYLGTLKRPQNELYKIKVTPNESDATTASADSSHQRYGTKVDKTKTPDVNPFTALNKDDLPSNTKSIQAENLEQQQQQREMAGATQQGTNMWAFHQMKNQEEKAPAVQIA